MGNWERMKAETIKRPIHGLKSVQRECYTDKPMILVVDHDPEVLEKAAQILNRDRQVFLASTAKQAFEMVQRLGFSVVLVDLALPGGGFALIQKLHDANPDLLIIAIAGALKAS